MTPTAVLPTLTPYWKTVSEMLGMGMEQYFYDYLDQLSLTPLGGLTDMACMAAKAHDEQALSIFVGHTLTQSQDSYFIVDVTKNLALEGKGEEVAVFLQHVIDFFQTTKGQETNRKKRLDWQENILLAVEHVWDMTHIPTELRAEYVAGLLQRLERQNPSLAPLVPQFLHHYMMSQDQRTDNESAAVHDMDVLLRHFPEYQGMFVAYCVYSFSTLSNASAEDMQNAVQKMTKNDGVKFSDVLSATIYLSQYGKDQTKNNLHSLLQPCQPAWQISDVLFGLNMLCSWHDWEEPDFDWLDFQQHVQNACQRSFDPVESVLKYDDLMATLERNALRQHLVRVAETSEEHAPTHLTSRTRKL